MNKEDGSLNLVNIENKDKALKVQWINNVPKKIKQLALILMENPIGNLIWQSNLCPADINGMFVEKHFWRVVLEYWCAVNYTPPMSNAQVRDQILWYDSDIRVDNKVIFYQKWYKAGIIRVEDILDEQNHFNI